MEGIACRFHACRVLCMEPACPSHRRVFCMETVYRCECPVLCIEIVIHAAPRAAPPLPACRVPPVVPISVLGYFARRAATHVAVRCRVCACVAEG
eukprot:121509-Pleurochrysis_carterae.AAC.1